MSKAAILYGVWIPICMLIVSYIKDEKIQKEKEIEGKKEDIHVVEKNIILMTEIK